MKLVARMQLMAFGIIAVLCGTAHAALITRTYNYTSGNTMSANENNTNENTVYSEINGNLNSANILDGGITNADIADSTIEGVKIKSTTTSFSLSSGTISTLNISTLNVVGNQAYTLLYSSTVFIYNSSCTTNATNTNFVPTHTAITLTPKSVRSRIEVTATGTIKTPTGATSDVYITIYRGSTNLAGPSDSFCSAGTNLAQIQNFPCSIGPLFDLPNTTSPVTYTVEMHNDGAAAVCWNNNLAVGPGTAVISVKEWGY